LNRMQVQVSLFSYPNRAGSRNRWKRQANCVQHKAQRRIFDTASKYRSARELAGSGQTSRYRGLSSQDKSAGPAFLFVLKPSPLSIRPRLWLSVRPAWHR